MWASVNAARADKNFQRAEQAEAALAERDQMLRLSCERGVAWQYVKAMNIDPLSEMSFDEAVTRYLADLIARAEEGGE